MGSPGSGSVVTCVHYMVLAPISLASMIFVHVTRDIVGVSLLDKCIFAPDSAIFKGFVGRRIWWDLFIVG